MSYAMTHLIIANAFMEHRKVENRELFLVASISPDAVHARKDFTFQLKADAHDLQKEEKWGQIYTKESMDVWYARLRDFYLKKMKFVRNEKERDFLSGYVLHILVDIFNCKLLYGKNLIRYNFDVDAMRDEYRKECILQDNFLYQNDVNTEKIMDTLVKGAKSEVLCEILQQLGLEHFISAENIQDTVDYQLSGYEAAAKASLEGLSMISKKSSDAFLQEVLQEAERMLFTFPPALDTFRMDI